MKKYIASILLAATAAICQEVEYKYMYMPFTRIGDTFVFGFETTPGNEYWVLNSTNGANWGIYTNFVATEYSYSVTTYLTNGMNLFRVKYVNNGP